MGRSIIQSFMEDILLSAGDLQLCAGQKGGCESVIHAMRSIFEEDECDAVLLIDADNAFNRINRKVMLHNIRLICPIVATYVHNFYNQDSRLFISGGVEISSREGTTQGDPIAMPLYALASLPLIDSLSSTSNTRQAAYADDLSTSGSLKEILKYWHSLCRNGPLIGYYPKASKCWLVVKPEKLELANVMFQGTGINVTVSGKRHLGAAIGSESFRKSFVDSQVETWVTELSLLAEIAKFHPQAAYCAFTAGYRHKFNLFLRTLPGIKDYLTPVEDIIRNNLIPALCENRACSDSERQLLSLPVRLGGLGLVDITQVADIEFSTSMKSTASLSRKIRHQHVVLSDEIPANQIQETLPTKASLYSSLLESLLTSMSDHQRKAIEVARSDGASIWLSSLPLRSENFHLSKREFFDAVYLRYGWLPNRLPEECVCSKSYSVDHALSCKVGGFIHMRHNDILNITADLLTTVCKDVEKEPMLQPCPVAKDELRADIAARGFWQSMQRAFVDVRVFYPFAQSYRHQSLSATMKSMEAKKKNKYLKRVLNDENGTFTPLVFTSNGGMSKETRRFYIRLAELIAEKSKSSYSETSAWIKRRLSFSLIRSSVMCIRGSRSRKYNCPPSVRDLDINDKLNIISS